MITEPKLLSDCGTCLVVDDKEGDRYQVDIEPGEYMVITAGSFAGTAMARFTHPNIAASAKRVLEFKHYRANGSKFWTARAGVDHIFIIPRTAIKMLPQKGYSYIPVEINGVKTIFNVSGGTMGGWTDLLHTHVSISCGHKLKDLKKLAEVAVRNSPLEPLSVKEMEPAEKAQWERLYARASGTVIEKVAKLIEEGKKPTIKMLAGYDTQEGIGLSVVRRAKKTITGDNCWTYEYTGALKYILMDAKEYFNGCRVKLNQVDWAKTAEANGLVA